MMLAPLMRALAALRLLPAVVTWTPALQFGGASVGVTYGTRTGFLFKFHRIRVAFAFIVLSSKGSSTGAATIGGLLDAISPLAYAPAIVGYVNALASITGSHAAYGQESGTVVNLGQQTTSFAALTDANFGNTSGYMIAVAYITN